MRALILLHRWLGVAFCLPFAMWFSSGIVMHFVPFPALTEAERFAGLAPIDLAGVTHGPAAAVAAGGIDDVRRVRLVQRSDGPVYLLSGPTAAKALRAADLADGAVHQGRLAQAIAIDDARRRHLGGLNAAVAGLVLYDQWTVSGRFDSHRPLYWIALDDSRGTELYVSSTTGEIVLDTARRERAWNYAGSVAHWIYPTPLRSHRAAWSLLLWWLSLLALIGASTGVVIGLLRVRIGNRRLVSPYRGWPAWHHWLGLICSPFVLTWIFSGWLSMDGGLLFATGDVTSAEAMAITGAPAWDTLPRDEIQRIVAPVREVEWFAFGGRIYRRERSGVGQQRLVLAAAGGEAAAPERAFLRSDEVDAAVGRLARACDPAVAVDAGNDYAVASLMPGAPVFRSICGRDWFDTDGAGGMLLEKLDPSRRVYRWLYGALHTLDFPVLASRPVLRAALITALCACGFAFSLTGVVMAWRRLLLCFRSPP